MADPRSPTEIAKFPTQFEAEAVAEVVRAEGIDAAVFGGGGAFAGGLGVFGQWSIMVPLADVERARRAIIEARDIEGQEPVIHACPGCGYSLDGLEGGMRCPECGHDIDVAREDAKVRGLVSVGRSTTPAWAWKVLGVGLAACVGVGLLAIVLEDLGPRIYQSWWTPLPIGLMVLAIGVAVWVLKRRKKS